MKLLLPVTTTAYWYFTAFFALSVVKPFLNCVLFSLDESQMKTGFLILFAMFSLQGTITDLYKSAGGYSAIWLIILYCMGVMAKRTGMFEKYSSGWLVLILIASTMLTWIFQTVLGTWLLTNYVSPTILMNGIILVVLFSRLKTGSVGRFLSRYYCLAFGIYLFQLNTIIWGQIKGSFSFVSASGIWIGVLQVLGLAALIFFAGLFVEIMRHRIFIVLKIDRLSAKISELFSVMFRKATVLLGCGKLR